MIFWSVAAVLSSSSAATCDVQLFLPLLPVYAVRKHIPRKQSDQPATIPHPPIIHHYSPFTPLTLRTPRHPFPSAPCRPAAAIGRPG